MHSLSLDKLLKILLLECFNRKNFIFIVFVLVSFSVLFVGLNWPKKYTSFSIIHIDKSNILQPLMRGAAETTESTDHVANAKEIIFSDRIMDALLENIGVLESEPSDVELALIKQKIKGGLSIEDVGDNLLKIAYTDSDQDNAYLVAKNISDLFIEVGENSKLEESQTAYDFINKQVDEYLQKLITIEKDLSDFRSNNPDARPGLQTEISNRISKLQKDIEDNQLLLKEKLIKKQSIQNQLSGEAAITISQTKQGKLREQMAELQTQLELLRLDYRDTYPDIVRIKAQLTDLKKALSYEIDHKNTAKDSDRAKDESYLEDSIILSPLYQELRSNFSANETEIATLKVRIDALNTTLQNEYEREKKIFSGEEVLSQLTRNYAVNQEIYQDLLKRRENARVSKNLDEEQKGFTFKVQQPAKIPLLPTGIRFLHFVIAGLVLGIIVPIGLIYAFILLDSRVRHSSIIVNELEIPVLAEVCVTTTREDAKRNRINTIILIVLMAISVSLYIYIGWLKYIGQI